MLEESQVSVICKKMLGKSVSIKYKGIIDQVVIRSIQQQAKRCHWWDNLYHAKII